MQTVYFKTSSFIQHEGNLVDLAAYRRKLSAVSGGWSPQVRGPVLAGPGREEPALRLLKPGEPDRAPRRRRSSRRHIRRLAMVLDLCASLAVVVLTLSAAACFLFL